MAYLTGITLELKEDVTKKLERMIPMVERLQRTFNRLDSNLARSEGLAKTNRQLDMMDMKLKKVSTTAGEMKNVTSGFNNVGNAAERSTKKVGFLAKSLSELGGAMKTMAIFGGIGAGIGLTFEGIKTGANFSQKLASLSYQGFSSSAQDRIKKQALAGGPDLMTPEEYVGFIKLASTGLPKDTAEQIAPIARRFQTAMRKLNVKGAMDENVAEDFAKIGELMTYRTPARFQMLADSLTRSEVAGGGQVPISQIRQQSARAGASRFGADPDNFFGTIVYGNQMMAGSKGGGGGSGSIGVQMAAVQQTLFSGRMQLSTAQALADLGLLDGWEQAKPQIIAEMLKKHQGKHHAKGKTIAKYQDGKLIETITQAAGGSSVYAPQAVLSLKEMKERKMHIAGQDILQSEGAASWAEKILIPKLEAANKLSPGQFWDMADNIKEKVKAMEMLVPVFGGTRQTMQKLMDELLIGHKQWLTFKENMKQAPGTEKVAGKEDVALITTKFQGMQVAWTKLMSKIFSDKQLLDAASGWLDRVNNAISFMNQNSDKFVGTLKFFSDWAQAFIDMVTPLVNPAALPDGAKDALKPIKHMLDPGGNLQGRQGTMAGKLGGVWNRLGRQAQNQTQDTINRIGGLLHIPPPPSVDMSPLNRSLSGIPSSSQPPPPPGVQAFPGHPSSLHGAFGHMPPGQSGRLVPPPPAKVSFDIHYHGPVIGTIPAEHARTIARAVQPHLDKIAMNNKQQHMGAASIGQGIPMPASIGGQTA